MPPCRRYSRGRAGAGWNNGAGRFQGAVCCRHAARHGGTGCLPGVARSTAGGAVSGLLLAFLIAEGIVFAAWAVVAFRWLFALRADAVAMSGSSFPGLRSTLRAFRGGLSDPRYRRHRLFLFLATLALLAMLVTSAMIM
jgi:hypothetical protein